MLDVFFRNGKPVELTTEDYANKTGLSWDDASLNLQELRRQGLLSSCRVKGLTIYYLAKEGK